MLHLLHRSNESSRAVWPKRLIRECRNHTQPGTWETCFKAEQCTMCMLSLDWSVRLSSVCKRCCEASSEMGVIDQVFVWSVSFVNIFGVYALHGRLDFSRLNRHQFSGTYLWGTSNLLYWSMWCWQMTARNRELWSNYPRGRHSWASNDLLCRVMRASTILGGLQAATVIKLRFIWLSETRT